MDDTTPLCTIHALELIYEPGGADMPTIPGRWYCPRCQAEFIAAMDDLHNEEH